MPIFHNIFFTGLCLIAFYLSSQELMARKVGLSHRLPKYENLSDPDFEQTYLAIKIYEDKSLKKNFTKFSGAILVNPCKSNEIVNIHGTREDPNYLLTLTDFTCDSSYRISFYVRVKNQPAVKVSGLRALRSRNLIADGSRNIIFEFTQVPVAVKPLWKNRSQNQISLRPNQSNY